jgi:hypothetical protein
MLPRNRKHKITSIMTHYSCQAFTEFVFFIGSALVDTALLSQSFRTIWTAFQNGKDTEVTINVISGLYLIDGDVIL